MKKNEEDDYHEPEGNGDEIIVTSTTNRLSP